MYESDAGKNGIFGWGRWMIPCFRTVERLARNREARIVLTFSVANALAALAGNRLLTEWAAPRELGTFYMYMNLALWLALPGAGAYTLVFRFWPLAKREGASRAVALVLAKGIAAEFVIAAIVVAGMRAVGVPVPVRAMIPLWITGAAQAAAQAAAPVAAAERRRITAGLMAFASTPSRYFVLAAGVAAGLSSAEALLWVQAGYSAALAVVGWMVLRSAVDATRHSTLDAVFDSGLTRQVMSYSLPYLLSAALAQVCTSAERWGLARIGSPSSTAMFVLAVGIATAGTNAVAAPLLSYYQPLITQAATAQDSRLLSLLRKLVTITGVAMAGAIVVALVFSEFATQLLFGSRYAAVAGVLPSAVIGATAFAMGQALAMFPYAARDAIGPNVALGVSQVAYAVALSQYRPAGDAASAFARVYAGAYVGYAVLMAMLAARWARTFALAPQGSEADMKRRLVMPRPE
ncbi:polysaccharide biosynthesis protein [Anaeromyxobacter terrae]|uniref:hypothetical protein n=1 Tax=Anaeromyxobacter terrae TaxID=2925406 RepID=UPI001F591433|nr:hypothetical protein [Anaeromyxobacter sp. SG22]